MKALGEPRPAIKRRPCGLQCAVRSVFDLFCRGGLDAPPEPALGPAEGEAPGAEHDSVGDGDSSSHPRGSSSRALA